MKVLITSIAVLSMLCGCGLAPPGVGPEELGRLQRIHDRVCPHDEDVVAVVGNDASDSVAESLWPSRRVAIQSEVELAAACNGVIKISEFARSSGATKLLYQGDLKPAGATLNARLRKVPELVSSVMSQVELAHAAKSPTFARTGTDVSGMFISAAAFLNDYPHAGVRRYTLLTDGWTEYSAIPPKMPGVQIRIAGVGVFDTSEKKAPKEGAIAKARARIDEYCHATGATCEPATSDYDPIQ